MRPVGNGAGREHPTTWPPAPGDAGGLAEGTLRAGHSFRHDAAGESDVHHGSREPLSSGPSVSSTHLGATPEVPSPPGLTPCLASCHTSTPDGARAVPTPAAPRPATDLPAEDAPHLHPNPHQPPGAPIATPTPPAPGRPHAVLLGLCPCPPPPQLPQGSAQAHGSRGHARPLRRPRCPAFCAAWCPRAEGSAWFSQTEPGPPAPLSASGAPPGSPHTCRGWGGRCPAPCIWQGQEEDADHEPGQLLLMGGGAGRPARRVPVRVPAAVQGPREG